ncbi:hypothetical protein [Streptomyces sp. NPDC053427]
MKRNWRMILLSGLAATVLLGLTGQATAAPHPQDGSTLPVTAVKKANRT